MLRSILCLAVVFALAPLTWSAPVVPISYTYSLAPWQYWDDTGHDLIDTDLASPFTGDPLWVGFGGGGAIDLNFGATAHIDTVSIHAFDRNGGAAIYLPLSVILSTSADNSSFTQLVSFPVSPFSLLRMTASSEQGVTGWIDVPANVDTQYLRVSLIPGGSWTFISELEFNNPFAVAPEPGSLALFSMGALALVFRQRRRILAAIGR